MNAVQNPRAEDPLVSGILLQAYQGALSSGIKPAQMNDLEEKFRKLRKENPKDALNLAAYMIGRIVNPQYPKLGRESPSAGDTDVRLGFFAEQIVQLVVQLPAEHRAECVEAAKMAFPFRQNLNRDSQLKLAAYLRQNNRVSAPDLMVPSL